ncbi:hypothetical protein A2524_04375 [Candidatus Wolfebacteria bacterium RIFOXYD12_FULL_48_21]|uniref:Uncharacterized protein n=1 Tax=Candidatus Wolfebacteria bacterium RIFOXYD1_FULL_48_65 TaxID=1802561 RepID=A0A1F8E345_9BACT|nr:MAG: hypothetical protein A2610_03455 [Candidatus Wolfebacteria bacterium RIFOXYD1_FULL_48_65]OGM95281.1 MAG: hypothetical protein A2524_04375 [Candidatus Wolfebacteria bacterium RIFOXYD12_FULL_48_21]OGM96850.1 MAG: hypothetical protein A2532_01735 [Candidatus Wolfebacteria bacterium RIFOXYD2_FULL_48_11]
MAEEKKCEWVDPRDRRFVLSRADELKSEGRVVLIGEWPTGKPPARLVASGSRVEDLRDVAEYKAGHEACITAHAMAGSLTPCVLIARRPPKKKEVHR